MGRRAGLDPYHRLVCALERRIFGLRSARHVVAISVGGKADIQRRYHTDPDHVSVVYNGVDLERFHPDNRARYRAATRKALGITGRAWVVLFVGSGFERKGLGPLIAAFARLADEDSRLIVTGKGNVSRYEAVAARLGIEEQVTWTGPKPDVEKLYAAADVVALPALYEPFGNVHLEAMASGVPVLSSAGAGGSEIIQQGENGWVVGKPVAPPTIAEGLAALKEVPAEGWAERVRPTVESFTYAAQAEGFTEIYQKLRG
jgi:UDP-glucose:(heptosyl)LPS alpha-1,3-glucosyltransferase